jgi:hypothetical protein
VEDTLSKSKVRLNLDISPKVKDQLLDLQKRSDAVSLVEVVRRAVAVYDMFLDHEENGGRTILENQDGTKERVRLLI